MYRELGSSAPELSLALQELSILIRLQTDGEYVYDGYESGAVASDLPFKYAFEQGYGGLV